MFNFLAVVAIIYLAVRWVLITEPRPIRHVYSQKGKYYYLKFALFYLMIRLRQWQNRRARDKGEANQQVGYGLKSKFDPAEMEKVQPLSEHPKALDAVYFQAASENGCYLVAATARRPHRVINGFVFLRIPQEGILLSPRLPDTTLFGDKDEFGAEGLLFTPIEPMRKWKISYKGKMRRSEDRSQLVDVELNAIWSSSLTQFDFDTDMSPEALSRSMAREPWSREYFQILQDAHQTHYEQMGVIEGTAVVDGKTYPLRLDSMRDHSYAFKREWKLLHRYAFHTFTLKDGTRINVGIVSQPCTSSVLELGYVYLPDGRLFPVDECHFKLWEHGEDGNPPSDYSFTFRAAKRLWEVQVNVVEKPEFFIGWEWEARLVERMCTFRVNGIPGWGVSEWHYRHMAGRDAHYDATDPQWTKTIAKE